MFDKSKLYNRQSDLHDVYGGQRQGGISTPSKHDFIMLFTSNTGEQYGYKDGWQGDYFFYTGEGQEGDMEFVRGNRAIRDHEENNKVIYVFEYEKRGHVNYIGQMRFVDYEITINQDKNGNERNIILFRLQSIK